VAQVSDVPTDRGCLIEVAGRKIALFRIGESVYAIDNVCPHKGGPLNEGILNEGVVSCPWHHWGFDVRTGAMPSVPSKKIACFAVRVEAGDVYLDTTGLMPHSTDAGVAPPPAPPAMSLRHLALQVSDVGKSRDFYLKLFGMEVVWAPDAENVYLSSGSDNLALHQVSPQVSLMASPATTDQKSSLDHFGFIVACEADVDQMAERAKALGVEIVHPVRRHRDGSYSFYFHDPDKSLIQILYEPRLRSTFNNAE
jgi:NAD(P)H-dependent nitrite reductase small subunit